MVADTVVAPSAPAAITAGRSLRDVLRTLAPLSACRQSKLESEQPAALATPQCCLQLLVRRLQLSANWSLQLSAHICAKSQEEALLQQALHNLVTRAAAARQTHIPPTPVRLRAARPCAPGRDAAQLLGSEAYVRHAAQDGNCCRRSAVLPYHCLHLRSCFDR